MLRLYNRLISYGLVTKKVGVQFIIVVAGGKDQWCD